MRKIGEFPNGYVEKLDDRSTVVNVTECVSTKADMADTEQRIVSCTTKRWIWEHLYYGDKKEVQDARHRPKRTCKSRLVRCEEELSLSRTRALEHLILKAALKRLDPTRVKTVEEAENVTS